MILSMTGFGRAELPYGGKTVVVEIRSLNGRTVDIRVKSAVHLGEHELDLRKIVQEHAIRGKIDVALDIRGLDPSELGAPNKDLIKSYYNEIKGIADELKVADDMILPSILKLPNVFQSQNGKLDPGLWDAIRQAAGKALSKLLAFRESEGQSIKRDMTECIANIRDLLGQVPQDEKDREDALKERLTLKMQELENDANVDKNRFEQEILFFLDKLDINEEKVRLAQHCDYFIEEIETSTHVKGKKLNFISQEIGREINTLGAKAQWSPIQRYVVQMKNELEKIKEQLPNVL
jgi:uncharacterized protein (TIGR00255 family)